MARRIWTIVAALALMSGPTSSQSAPSSQQAQTAQSVLQALSKTMGADNLRCISYTGTNGYVGIVGQAHDINFILSNPNGLDHDQVAPRGVHHCSHVGRGSCQAAQ